MIETVGIITEKIMTIMLIIANRGVALNNYLYEVKKEIGYGWMDSGQMGAFYRFPDPCLYPSCALANAIYTPRLAVRGGDKKFH
jgi:hypothetical protein